MKVITFYTTGEAKEQKKYQSLANKLVQSGKPFGIDVVAYHKGYPGCWRDALYLKAKVIREALSDFPKDDILWLDADSYFVSHPSLLFQFPESKHTAGYCATKGWFWGCTHWFRNTPQSVALVESWIKENEEYNEYLDDHNFFYMVNRDKKIGMFTDLPPTYAWLPRYHRPRFGRATPVIIQGMTGCNGNMEARTEQAKNRPWGDAREY
ncbi:hypothetical protein [uncultured Mediterranean phage]|nr:hypothetical protein [uncultured Mediterranean phage]